VALEHLKVVHVLLEVLDHARVVGAQEPLARVRPREGPYGRVVRLRARRDDLREFEHDKVQRERSSRSERGGERTWRIVSKLNVSPFQSVNSPEVEPVKMRRASGVNCRTSASACALSSSARPNGQRGRSDAR